MPAAYDTYDYPAYWADREYEHKAEYNAIKTLLNKIPEAKTILEVGAGYGRLFSSYSFRAKRVILSDPSASILSKARKKIKNKKVLFFQSSLESLKNKINKRTIDLILMVRVLHHIKDTEEAFKQISDLLKEGGYFILEFANKGHIKATLAEFIKGNLTFPIDIFPKDLGNKKRRKRTLPFINYHPDAIEEQLKNAGFSIIEKLSVSNIRSPFIKKYFQPRQQLKLKKYFRNP